MTMHLCHPSITMMGKRKGKQKFRSAAEAQKARELAASWEQKQREWSEMSSGKVAKRTTNQKQSPQVSSPVVTSVVARDTPKIASLNSWVTGPVSSKPSQHYSGDEVLGISVLHKSCLQPVFSAEAAVDIAKMRRG
jgi:hypothetical protein